MENNKFENRTVQAEENKSCEQGEAEKIMNILRERIAVLEETIVIEKDSQALLREMLEVRQ